VISAEDLKGAEISSRYIAGR